MHLSYQIYYALPAFAGHISTTDKNRINKFFQKAFHRMIVKCQYRIGERTETNTPRHVIT